MTIPESTSILMVGGGPCGLMLANELGRRGADAVLVDDEESTTFNPQANATQARTMEHYRRLGIAEEIRKAGLPADYPTDVAYFTRFFGYELARKKQPSASKAVSLIKEQEVAWSAAEPPHRVAQKYVEKILRHHAEALPTIQVHYGWRLIDFEDRGADGVVAKVQHAKSDEVRTITARFLIGADGPRSTVREKLAIKYAGEDQKRDFMGGSMFAVYLRSPEFKNRFPHPPAWMHESFNVDRRAFMAAVNGTDEYAFHTQLREDEKQEGLTEEDARGAFQKACGEEVPCEVLSHMTWKAGHTLVAERMQSGNVFISGDAAHLFTPTGGLGYNTAIEDAVNLGWKLASVVKGLTGAKLLDTYEAERRPVAIRNTNFARQFADSLGNFKAKPAIEEDSAQGEAARREAGEYLDRHVWAEFNIPGITFGYRYDGSPVIIKDGTKPPEDAINTYNPTACPGGRAPHAWLEDGTSLFDHFGFDWTLLDLSPDSSSSAGFRDAAKSLGLELKIVNQPKTLRSELYHAALTLVRPDQIVAWRGEAPDDSEATDILKQVLGCDGAKVRLDKH